MLNILLISLPYARHLLILYKNADSTNTLINCILFIFMVISICSFGISFLRRIFHIKKGAWIVIFFICFGAYTVTLFNQNSTRYFDEQSIKTVIHYHQLRHLTNERPYINANSNSKRAKAYRALEHKYYNESHHHYVTKNTHQIHYNIADSAVNSKPRWWQYL